MNQRFEDSPEGLRVTTELDVGLDMTSPLSVPLNQVRDLSNKQGRPLLRDSRCSSTARVCMHMDVKGGRES